MQENRKIRMVFLVSSHLTTPVLESFPTKHFAIFEPPKSANQRTLCNGVTSISALKL